MATPETRLGGLDILRGSAVLLVFVRHVPIKPNPDLNLAERLLNAVYEFGWTGVDLFYVLSGFLIAGLLFADLRRFGRVRLARFWFRRGMKIWPCYYLLFGVWLAAQLHDSYRNHPPPVFDRYVESIPPNALFYQNYAHDKLLWPASWSIAVEEHFYFVLPIVLAVAAGRIRHRVGVWVVVAGGLGLVLPLAARVLVADPADLLSMYLPTHCRSDCLLAGVLLRYLYDYAPAAFARFARWARWLAPPLLLAAAVVCVRYPIGQHVHLHAWTLSLNVIAYACLVAAAVDPAGFSTPRVLRPAADLLSWIGRYSYSSYLVHAVIFSLPWVLAQKPAIEAELGGPDAPLFRWTYRCAYWALSLLGGYALAKLVEGPILRWRDRVWPSKRAARVESPVAAT